MGAKKNNGTQRISLFDFITHHLFCNDPDTKNDFNYAFAHDHSFEGLLRCFVADRAIFNSI